MYVSLNILNFYIRTIRYICRVSCFLLILLKLWNELDILRQWGIQNRLLDSKVFNFFCNSFLHSVLIKREKNACTDICHNFSPHYLIFGHGVKYSQLNYVYAHHNIIDSPQFYANGIANECVYISYSSILRSEYKDRNCTRTEKSRASLAQFHQYL